MGDFVESSMMKRNPGRNETENSGVIWKAGSFQWDVSQRALVMAILNVTPDSFSDGGRHFDLKDTLAAARQFIDEGADILDVGGESTRPGSAAISSGDEISRVVPVIRELVRNGAKAISVDTCKASVAAAALEAGADLINDISGLRDPEMIDLCASTECGIVVMHMQGTPRTMQKAPRYSNVVSEVKEFFKERYLTLTEAGIDPDRIAFDPGIGFGKTLSHNLALLRGVEDYRVSRRPILMGLSRKSLIAKLLGVNDLDRRENPSQALTALTRSCGAMIHRTHQVREIVETLRMVESLL